MNLWKDIIIPVLKEHGILKKRAKTEFFFQTILFYFERNVFLNTQLIVAFDKQVSLSCVCRLGSILSRRPVQKNNDIEIKP